ncbi:DNA-processing protein DprA [Alkalilimnicola sp. S0819]|uniref:DNA-processing protein DprA n=1 Tax=Alkalilimnicola sp. S0819 TaxID=2613922 RepID=UPI00126150A4|nr:DNA-processing protein DprA [Alkalilimnicola sp. S0819]KAB7627240.1 DNA-protecting protein DprA [Alkalilimnicola sp. S0819]MPQ15953.1 DNA-protecting protein DprA [Alkalilimnicola sp. S0819]
MPSRPPEPAPSHADADWLRLWRQPGIGPKAFLQLLEHFGDPGAALNARDAQLQGAGLDARARRALRTEPDETGLAADLAWLAEPHHHLLRYDSSGYPARLRDLPDPPPLLFVVGDPDWLRVPQLAIIGSRKASAGGLDNAREFAAHLTTLGLTVSSGMALGVDAAAHEGALQAGGGTVAVIGTGPDRVYPARHRALAHRIARQGCLVSEYPTGVGPRPEHFPRRNRILSGLSHGVLVVEAGLNSGSLITARLALEQGREVFAIPGSIHNPLAKGCHRLIRDGAKLVESAEHVLEELSDLAMPDWTATGPREAENAPETAADDRLDPEHQQVLDALGHDPTPLELVLQRTGLTPDVVSSILLLLELRGYVTASAGGRYQRR